MPSKIMSRHRHAELDALGEQIFANACNWLRVPGQRRTRARGQRVYREPTPHPSHRRRLGEPEAELDDWEPADDDSEDDSVSEADSSPGERTPGPTQTQLQRRGGQRVRNPLSGRRSAAPIATGPDQDVAPSHHNEPPPVYSEHDALQGQQDPPDSRDEPPTPEQEIQAIVRNVHQRRQVVVIQPSIPFPDYSAGEIVDDPRETITTTISRAQNVRLVNIASRRRSALSTRNTAVQTNPTVDTVNESQGHDQPPEYTSSGDSMNFSPGPPEYATGQNEEAPTYFLPSPALDLSGANLTGSLSSHQPGFSPGGLFSSNGQHHNVRTDEDDEIIMVEHVENVSLEGRLGGAEIRVQHVENVPQARYRDVGTDMKN